MKKHTKELVELVGCEYELFNYPFTKDDILSRFSELIEEGKGEFTPLIVIPSEILLERVKNSLQSENFKLESEEYRKFVEKVIENSEKIDVEEMIADGIEEYIYEDLDEDLLKTELGFFEFEKGFSLYWEEYPPEEILILKVDTLNPWELPAWVPIGSYETCRENESQVAMFKYWYDKYESIPAIVDYEMWELYVNRPAKSIDEIIELAKEQCSFAPDIVYNGLETLELLGISLYDNEYWYFWWD